jgi:pimeloyl-ACP methyl ester carboxylesterase
MLTRTQYFLLFVIVLLLLAVFTALSPAFVNVDLFYPKRIDSLFVLTEAQLARADTGTADEPDTTGILFSPSSLDLNYETFDVITTDSLVLRGWYCPAVKPDAPTLLILHDLNESKILYLDMLKQLHDRDIHICIADLRAHGNSEGKEFTPGMVSVRDVQVLLDSLFTKSETQHIYLMGVGLGAFIATQSTALDDRISGLILENGFVNYEGYLDFYATHKWGRMKFLFMTPFLSKVKHQIQQIPAELDLSRLLALIRVPTLFIAGGRDDFAAASESAILKDSSIARQKELFLIRNSFHSNTAETGDDYYNRIAEFIVRTIPPKQKKSRYKKLALH